MSKAADHNKTQQKKSHRRRKKPCKRKIRLKSHYDGNGRPVGDGEGPHCGVKPEEVGARAINPLWTEERGFKIPKRGVSL